MDAKRIFLVCKKHHKFYICRRLFKTSSTLERFF